ncbi:hypothetical protein N7513_004859 [Penicillium frequentans]|nr:hypothetical protein N7513_004859 [Penicillium glabrum]
MPAAAQEQTRQNTTTHYLRKERLEARLRELFPDVKDFKIRMQNDEYSFIAPRRVEAIELLPARVVTESDEE